jgi:membrane protein DedA with SNARE-associated domain/rhodanese-related sulfurtransferase
VTASLSSLITNYGVLVVFGNVLVDQIGLPIPAVPTLLFAGGLAADGKLSAPAVFAVSVLACLIADLGWYVAGRYYGSRIMKMLCRISLTPDSCVSSAESRFERWGLRTLLFAKFVPGLDLIAPPLAGASRIGWVSFVIFDGIGSALWVAAVLGGGLLLRSQIESLLAQVQRVGLAAGLILGALLLTYIAYKWWERRRFYRTLRMARISVDELYRLIDEGAAPVIVDVRSHGAIKRDPKRIPGAVVMPLDAPESEVTSLPRDRDIVLYCSCPNEASSARVAKILMDHGFRKVRPLLGGLEAWVAAGYSVEVLASEQSSIDVVVRTEASPADKHAA